MKNKVLGQCPVCNHQLKITRLHCRHCDTTIEGSFELCKFSRLSQEHKDFIDVFIKNRGNIKEIERELGISYPTVRNKLEGVIEALGHSSVPITSTNKKDVLESLSRGEITAEEAVKLLKE
ncbi:DUF2089 domain-containing protein [Alkaliphilus peptidifermentans]|uniref:DUF2089 domain-containing protein n=1 Tax=Alkaliphilus peptidifermentans DSM 18978 TaxID=1120976 RepID=A0A1G5AVZ6_9FIRM|nr:DUF2089 domain-containing protein [Alkaliphilus peptidifermentans]SCX82046.1 hypothetical protein SAMN03080606_00305 [Alkaliphilus peptidifermentans DSM 18978]